MKSFLVLAALGFSLPVFAALNPVGDFAFAHSIAFFAYDEQGCKEAEGQWDGDICLFDAEDSVSVTGGEMGSFNVRVSTVATNAHTCDFDGKGEMVSANQLKATAPSEVYIPGENGKDGRFESATCEVSVTFLDGNSVKVESGETCSYFCGARAHLDIEKAVRK